jgi:predicted RNA-binding protein with PIN domain
MPHIIDGHNLIGTGLLPGIRLEDPDDEVQLLERLRAYRARGGPDMMVFFDSGGLPGSGAPAMRSATQRVLGLEVRFSSPGEVADDAIVAYIARQRQPGQFTVVTNDNALAQRARLAGANTVTAQHFARSLLPATRPERQPRSALAEPERPVPAPKDPAFADIYATFVEAEQSTGHVGHAEYEIQVARLLYGDALEARRAAAWLGTSRRQEAVDPLCTALLHDDASVRAAAALALGTLGSQAALGDLVNRLQTDDNSMVREAAAQSLGRLGDRSLEGVLEAVSRSDRKSKVRKAASTALIQIRARR